MDIIKHPTVSLIARPQFTEPAHLRVEWKGEATDGERVAEYAGRLCYMSQHNPAGRTTAEYLQNILRQGHGSVFEHAVYVLLVEGISRSCSHELVRHRAGFGYSQLSQRYVDESNSDYVEPDVIAADPELHAVWCESVNAARAAYDRLVAGLEQRYASEPDRTLRRKLARQAARSVLPNATETKIFVTGNARALRHFIELRGSEHADVEIRKAAVQILGIMQKEAPSLFGDYTLVPLPDGSVATHTDHLKV
jgi:thymidylate synthase (FAD)